MSLGPEREHAKSGAPEQHLEALAGFAARDSLPGAVSRLPELARDGGELIEKYLEGDREEDTIDGLKRLLPAVADCLRAIASELDPVRSTTPFVTTGPGWTIRSAIHAGAHIQAAIWGLSPEIAEAEGVKTSTGKSYSDPDLLEHNLTFSRHILETAEQIQELWNQAKDAARELTD